MVNVARIIQQPSGDVAAQILYLILRHANFLETPQWSTAFLHPEHFRKISAAVESGSPLVMVLPAFPAKSPNPEKTLGPRADMAEVLGLSFLQNLCDDIAKVYVPGARVVVCSDGRVFSDLVGVDDSAVSRYSEDIEGIIEEFDLDTLSTFGLEDLFGDHEFSRMRALLVDKFARPLEEVRSRAKSDEGANRLFNGIHRFIVEDQLVLQGMLSKNQISKISKQIAYEVIQRSNAWSELVESVFPNALRLSIHPQLRSSRKLGVSLVPCENQWRTPWHSVALWSEGSYKLVRRKSAVEMGARENTFQGRYGFFALEGAP